MQKTVFIIDTCELTKLAPGEEFNPLNALFCGEDFPVEDPGIPVGPEQQAVLDACLASTSEKYARVTAVAGGMTNVVEYSNGVQYGQSTSRRGDLGDEMSLEAETVETGDGFRLDVKMAEGETAPRPGHYVEVTGGTFQGLGNNANEPATCAANVTAIENDPETNNGIEAVGYVLTGLSTGPNCETPVDGSITVCYKRRDVFFKPDTTSDM